MNSTTTSTTSASTSTSTTQQTSLDPPASSCCSSSVTFSLLSACWACQWNQPLKDRVVTTFKVYQAQCAPNIVRIGSFDAAVQLRLDNAAIAVPPWAAIRPDPDALWFVFRLISSHLISSWTLLNLKSKSKAKAKAPACCVHTNRDEYAAQVNATLTLTLSSPLPTSTISSSLATHLPLSGGAIAGITLGCLAFLAALLTAFYFWCRRRRRRRRTTVRSVNSKARSPISPRSPWRNFGRSETMKSQGGGGGGGGGGAKVDLDLDFASGVPELLSSGGGGGGGGGRERESSATAAGGGGGGRNRKSFGSVLANVRRLTPPRRPPNPQSSNLNFHLVESNSTSTHTQSQTHPHAQFQLRHPYAYPLPQSTPTPTFTTADVPPVPPVPPLLQHVHTHAPAQPPSPTEHDNANGLSRASSAFKWMKATVQRFTPTSPKASNLSPTSASSPRLQHQPRPMIDLLSSDPTAPHNQMANTDTDTYIPERNRMSERSRNPVLRSPPVDPNRPPSPRADSEPMELSTAKDLAWIGGVAGTAPLREDVLQGAWVGEGGALFISRESLERREKERRRWRDDGPVLLPTDNGSVDDDDKEERMLREVMERSRMDTEGWGAARVGYVPAQTRPPPQASGSGLSHGHLHITTMAQQPQPQLQPLQQEQQQEQSTRSHLPEIRFSPSPLLTPGMMPGSVFPSHTSLLNPPPPPPHPPTRPPQVASTSGQVQLQPSQLPLRPLPQLHQPELYPTVITTMTTDTGPQADLPEIQIRIPPLEAASTGSPISPSLLAPSGLSPTSLEWISPPESFIEHPDVPVSVYSSGNGGGRRSKRRSKGGVWQVTSPIDAPVSSMPFGAIAGSGGEGLATQKGEDSVATGLKRTDTHPPRISKPQGARAKDALPSSITKRMFAKVGVGLGSSGGGGGASAVGKHPQMQHPRSMSVDSTPGIGNGRIAGSSGNLHPPFVAPGPPPPLVVRPTSASNVRATLPQPASAVRPGVQQQPSVSAPSLIPTRHPLPPLPFGIPSRPVLSPIPGSPLPLSPSAPQSPPTRGPRLRPTSPPLPQGELTRDSRFSMLSLLQPPSGHSHAQSQSQSQLQSQSNISQVLSPPPEEERQFASPIGSPDPAQSATYAMPFMRIDSTDSILGTGTGRGVRRLPPIPGGGQPPA